MAPSQDGFINPNDFESIRVYVKFKNLTTNTEVLEPTRSALVESGPELLVLDLPKASCNAKHNVMVEVYYKESAKANAKLAFSATGKVRSIQKEEDERLRTEIDLIQFDEEGWKRFMKIFEQRQEDILNFFQQVKG